MDTGAKSYEVAYLISPALPEDEVFGEAGKITAAIQDAHGLVGRIEEPKKRRLAYPIRLARRSSNGGGKLREAYFGWTTFAIAPERLTDIERRLKAEPNVVRYLIAEEVKRPAAPPRLRLDRARRPAVPAPRLEGVKPFTPAAPKEEDKTKLEELDKKLEEILGK